MTWARPGLGRAGLLLASGVYQRVQGSEGYLQDMVRVRGEGKDDGRHGEWHDVMTWPCHGANNHGIGQVDLGKIIGY
jgi:hypothetical protein